MNFGTRLRKLRRDAGFTQRQLAIAVGLDFSYISKLENGHNPPPAADTIVRLCQAMNVTPEPLLALTGKLPSDVHESVGLKEAAQQFLRETHDLQLTDGEWRRLSQSARRLRARK
jgi:transcriptional regulator with XRE-family HTH domain